MRSRIQPLLDTFEAVSLTHPIHDAILVGVAQDQPPLYFQEIPNADGFFHVVVGWPSGCDTSADADEGNLRYLVDRLRAAAAACPFSKVDVVKIQKVFDDWERQQSNV